MIYKFSPPSEYALENLKTGTLFCRHFEDFNDPFEFWFKLESGLPDLDDLSIRFQRAVTAWGFPGIKKADPVLDDEIWVEYFGSLAEGAPLFTFDNARITCFSSEINNLLMWSHYADGLRGFSIEFNEAELIDEDESTSIVKVNYTNKPPIIDSLEYAIINDQFEFAIEHGYEEYEGEVRRVELNEIIRNAIASKPKEWQYEKELRLVIMASKEDKKPVSFKYPSKSIKSIILGEKMSDDFKTRIKDLVSDLDLPITIKTAVRSKDAYHIKVLDIG
jgi:hypothetical protein